MATKSKFWIGKNNKGKDLYDYNGNPVTSEEYTDSIESLLFDFLNLESANRIQDKSGIDGFRINEDGDRVRVQIKIMHRSKSTKSLSRYDGILHASPDDHDWDQYRSALWQYCSQFDELILYLGDANIGAKFDPTNIAIIRTKLAMYQCLYLRTYRGYCDDHFAQLHFNKTCKSDLVSEFLTYDKAEKWRQNVLKHLVFCGNSNRLQYNKKFFKFWRDQQFTDCKIERGKLIYY